MRITTSMYYKSIYGKNNSTLNKELFDVNKQIASGLKIQYAKDDISTFTETMRLDNEIVTLGQIKKSTESGFKLANQTDVILNEFETSLNRMRTLLVQAANGTNDSVSLDAIAQELRAIEDHSRNLANSSLNGQYIFSGSAVDIKPISDDGTYNGNDSLLNAFTGSRTSQQYNISGDELFLGETKLTRKQITTNVVQNNLSTKYPDYTNPSTTGTQRTIRIDDSIRDLMGDTDNNIDTVNFRNKFYVRGTKSDGTAFEKKISMRDDQTIDNLLTQIGDLYGNTPDLKLVNVNLNQFGQIVIEDKNTGSSKLDFSIVGAVDYSGGTAADVAKIDDLDVGEKNFDKIILGTSTAANSNLYVNEFIKSSLTSATGAASNIEGLIYDRTQFSKDGAKLSSGIAQIEKGTNKFASGSTKISEVADLSQGTAGTLDGTKFKLTGIDINGTAYNVDIDLFSAGSTFTVGGNTYDIFNMQKPRTAVDADKMTYQQLMDVINMVITNNLPATTNTATDYDDAIGLSTLSGSTYLSYDGKLQFQEINTSDTKASLSLYDSNSGDFSKPASVMTFNNNNSLTIRDPKTDFFKTMDKMITAVEDHKLYPDASSGTQRSIGIEDALIMMDDLQDHVFRSHAQVGAQSNALSSSIERTGILEISSQTLRSSVIDTDLAEASLTLSQLTINYEAMLATVGKISQLSLVNYL